MSKPLARDEDRAAHVEAERVVLERRAVAVAHQEADEALVGLVHHLFATGERDAGAVHDGQVVGQRSVEPDETVVEQANRLIGSRLGHRQGSRTLVLAADVAHGARHHGARHRLRVPA